MTEQLRGAITILESNMKHIGRMLIFLAFTVGAHAYGLDRPIVVIGGSFENGQTPCVIRKINAVNCLSVNFGDYLSLGQALANSSLSNGKVLVEAIGGATTFDRSGYTIPTEQKADVGWELEGYTRQLHRALLSVTNPFTFELSARYVVIGIANDCLHSNAFETAPSDSTNCSPAELNEAVDRYVTVGQAASEAGLIPVFLEYPPLADLGENNGIDWAVAQVANGFLFTIDDSSYQALSAAHAIRVAAEVPGALVIDAWQRFRHIGDGLHPTEITSKRAARAVLLAILKDEK